MIDATSAMRSGEPTQVPPNSVDRPFVASGGSGALVAGASCAASDRGRSAEEEGLGVWLTFSCVSWHELA